MVGEHKSHGDDDQDSTDQKERQGDHAPTTGAPLVNIESVEPPSEFDAFGNSDGKQKPKISSQHARKRDHEDNERKSIPRKMNTPEWISAISAAATAFFAFVALVISIISLIISENGVEISRNGVKAAEAQLKEMQSSSSQTEAMVNAATNQAQAAKALAELTRENQILSQRARIAPSGAQIGGEIGNGLPVKIDVSFVNYGVEGAEDFNFSVKGFFGDSKLWNRGGFNEKVATLKTECMHRDTFEPGMTIFPIQVSAKTLPVDLADEDVHANDKMFWSKRAVSGDDVVVITGCFTYRTVEMRRHTFFCYYANVVEFQGGALGNCRAGHLAD